MGRIVVVTPNPAVDVTYRVAEQRIGVTQRVLDVVRRPGGKGVNVVRVLDALGTPAVSLLPLGGGSGDWIVAALEGAGSAVARVPIGAETRSTVTVVDDHAHPTMFGEPGPVITAAEWDAVRDTVRSLLADADALIVSGSLPRNAPATIVGHWVADARDAGVPTVVDVSGDALIAAADAGADIIAPNRDELCDATGTDSESSGARALLRRGAHTIVVSAGTSGITAYTADGVTTQAAVSGVTGNPTGAGDAATAGLTHAIVHGRALQEALRTAAASGAAAVLRPVAGEIDRTAFTRFLTDLNGATS